MRLVLSGHQIESLSNKRLIPEIGKKKDETGKTGISSLKSAKIKDEMSKTFSYICRLFTDAVKDLVCNNSSKEKTV